jgi:hypothetical protein
MSKKYRFSLEGPGTFSVLANRKVSEKFSTKKTKQRDSVDFEMTSRRAMILTPERTNVRDGVEI